MVHVNLVIATPGYSLTAPYVKSLMAFTGVLDSKKITWAFASEHASHVADARELTISSKTNSMNNVYEQRPFGGDITYDKILWIDSDIEFTPEDALKLYSSDLDIVSGCYLFPDGKVVAYKNPFSNNYSKHELKDKKDPIEVASVGFGFICIKAGIFEKMERPWFQSAEVEISPKNMPTHKFQILGEDFSWCIRAKKMGYKIWLDPTIKLTHHKTVPLGW